jgi:beta-ketodecanoyl-[acyl-carrier-protein] synthase
MQNGKNVREEVVPLTSEHILKHLSELSINPQSIKRLWLHQANIHMNHAIAQNVLGRTASEEEVPTILADCGNTGASGVMIAFHKSHSNLRKGDIGVLCSFGAGYSVGSVVLEKTK